MKYLLLLFLLLQFKLSGFSQVESKQSGLWTDPTTWEGGIVPTQTDNVVISSTHHVILDTMNTNSYTVVQLCNDLTVEDNAQLSIGHNDATITKRIRIFGHLLIDGVLYKGEDFDENPFIYNTKIELAVQQQPTSFSGKGAFNCLSLKLYAEGGERTLNIDHHYMNIDDAFFIKSVDKLFVNIAEDAYLNVKGTLGVNGQSYTYIDDNTSAELTNEGVIMTNNLVLATKNVDPAQYSKLIVKGKGFLTTSKVNNEDGSIKNTAASFRLVLKDGGTLRLLEVATNPRDIIDDNLWITVMTGGEIRSHYKVTASTDDNIINTVEEHRPSNGYVVDDSFKEVYGATFTGGLYHFTDEPYLIEGKEKYKEMGSTTIKTKVSAEPGKMQDSYPFHMTWDGSTDMVDVVKDPYYQQLLSDPYYTEHVLWVTPKKQKVKNVVFYKYGAYKYDQYFKEHEEEYYELAKYLLETYSTSGKKFLFQNWEGDWMLRGQSKSWENDPSLIPENVDEQIEGMIRLFQARQRGVDRARAEVLETNAEIMHGIEINKLWTKVDEERVTMMDLDVPCLTHDILPHVRTDFNSWSSYDGVWPEVIDQFPVGMWKGVEVLEYYTNESGRMGDQSPIQLGEFGINENMIHNDIKTIDKIEEMYDKLVACAVAQKWNNIFVWSFYSTDVKSYNFVKGQEYSAEMFYQYSDGKWVINPDGDFGIGGKYFQEVLKPEVITATTSGNWSATSTWDKRVPTSEDHVVIPQNIEVVLDEINTNSNTELTIAQRLNVKGTLQLGHDETHTKNVRVNGDIFVDGTIEKGAFTKNARLYQKLPLLHNSGKGTGNIDVLTYKYFGADYDTAYLKIDQQSIQTEEHFFIKSDNKVVADILENTNVSVGKHFALTGSAINWLDPDAQAEVNIYGDITALNVNLLTLNTDTSKPSILRLKSGGQLSVDQVNQQSQTTLNGAATFTFEIENGGMFNTSSATLHPSTIVGYDPNFIFTESSNARLIDDISLDIAQPRVFLPERSNMLHIENITDSSMDIFLYDMNGQLVFSKEGIDNSQKIPLQMNKGIYLIRYTHDDQEKVVKVLL
ncbi:T9SS type A sorting domain-containing protein [Flammeovirga agarivorans]|uniref:T9SS type A sorting domain-containing protein n=1 Tax=Flammeovirga agarivorans TaxID=2726742 RepID=A0A7X8SK60_9BACT|nr:T9SS type A sorting domain-containing protein [Flammeovirga agarivorans]NLR91724.1 T9SS type A sorting domain-containing protein [Flammeovirga agarivorans]